MVVAILLAVIGLVGAVSCLTPALALGSGGFDAAAFGLLAAGLFFFIVFFIGMHRLQNLLRRDRRDRWDGYHRH